MDAYLHKFHFLRSEMDDTLYFQLQGINLIILIMYVDDLLVIGNTDNYIFLVNQEHKIGFEITNFLLLHYYLGFEVIPKARGIFISQSKYWNYRKVWYE
jgi:hypothetical protein